MSYSDQRFTRNLRAAQAAYDNELPPEADDDSPDLAEVLAGTDTSLKASELYDVLANNGQIDKFVEWLNDDYDTQAALVRLVMRHKEESEVLCRVVDGLVAKMERGVTI